MGDIVMNEDDVVVPTILATHLDGLQDGFDDEPEEKKAGHSSRTHPGLERAKGDNDNWVEKAGGLPKYIERIAKHLHYDQGMPISQAIATAINTVKRWAKGGGDVKPDTVAKAAAALAQWEKMKAGRKDLSTVDDMETKGHEYKNVSVKGLQVADASTGIVEAIVSVTGIVDEVKDIIKPGAYAKTLSKRTPKGVYSHSWDQPISRTVDIKELLPGDPSLPKTMGDGTPWPREAGALWVKMQFNLDTERGRTAFSDVKFFGDEQEWSIGYNVPVGGAKVNPKAGVREIDTLDLFEYSPVLFGAMPLAATQSVKDAQTAYKAMRSQGMWSEPTWDTEAKVDQPDEDDGDIELATNETDVESNLDDDQIGVFEVSEDGMVEADLDEYDAVDAEDVGIKALFGPDDLHIVVKALNALNELLGTATGYKAHSQVPGNEVADESDSKGSGTPSSVSAAVSEWFGDDTELKASAEALDEALGSSDEDAIESAANDFLDLIETRMDGADDETTSSLTDLAKLVAEMIEAAGGKEPPSEQTQEKGLPPHAAWNDDDFEDEGEVETIDLSTLSRLRASLDGNS